MQRAQGTTELLTFRLNDQLVALNSSVVREVLAAPKITWVPGLPDFVEGVVDVRGSVVPVFDLRSRFGYGHRPLRASDHLILAWNGPRLVALRVDGAEELVVVPNETIEGSLEGSVKGMVSPRGAIAGIARTEGGLVVIHDLERFLSPAESTQLDDALITYGAS